MLGGVAGLDRHCEQGVCRERVETEGPNVGASRVRKAAALTLTSVREDGRLSSRGPGTFCRKDQVRGISSQVGQLLQVTGH